MGEKQLNLTAKQANFMNLIVNNAKEAKTVYY
jgi:hypothetical protein